LGEQVVLCSGCKIFYAEYSPKPPTSEQRAQDSQGGPGCLDSDSNDEDWEAESADSGVQDDRYSKGDDNFHLGSRTIRL
jgi:hypothetical protein